MSDAWPGFVFVAFVVGMAVWAVFRTQLRPPIKLLALGGGIGLLGVVANNAFQEQLRHEIYQSENARQAATEAENARLQSRPWLEVTASDLLSAYQESPSEAQGKYGTFTDVQGLVLTGRFRQFKSDSNGNAHFWLEADSSASQLYVDAEVPLATVSEPLLEIKSGRIMKFRCTMNKGIRSSLHVDLAGCRLQ